MDENKNGYSWILMDSTDGSNPLKNQVLAGYDKDGDQIYVGRTYHAGDLLPANVIPSKNVAYVSYAGEEIPKDKFEVLCGSVFEWVASENGLVPDGAVPSGHNAMNELLYIARGHINSSVVVGKVHPSHGCLYVPFGGVEESIKQYEVLVECPIASCNWVSSVSGEPVPDSAVVGGFDISDNVIYVIRANHLGYPIPGKYIPSHRSAYVPYNRREHAKQEYEFLCDGNVAWVAAAKGYVPPNAVVGGMTEENETLYIGRSHFSGTLTPGKIQPSQKALFISFGGSEVPIEEYEVLVEKK